MWQTTNNGMSGRLELDAPCTWVNARCGWGLVPDYRRRFHRWDIGCRSQVEACISIAGRGVWLGLAIIAMCLRPSTAAVNMAFVAIAVWMGPPPLMHVPLFCDSRVTFCTTGVNMFLCHRSCN